MIELIEKGYAIKCNETDTKSQTLWYLPHNGVYHSKKPDKIRVVFDCSSVFRGESLNKNLLQGPVLTNSLDSEESKSHLLLMWKLCFTKLK